MVLVRRALEQIDEIDERVIHVVQRRMPKHRQLEVLEVYVLDEARDFSGRCIPNVCNTCGAGCERPGLRHNKSRVMNVTKSLQAHCCSFSHTLDVDIQQKLGEKQAHESVRRQVPPRTAAQPDGNHGEHVYLDVLTLLTKIGLGQGILLSELYGTSKASRALLETLGTVTSESLSSLTWSMSRVFPGTQYHASHVTT